VNILLVPFHLFGFHPATVYLVAALFLILSLLDAYSARSKWILRAVGTAWILYGFWERYMTNWRSPTGDRAIRIDLLLVCPVVILFSVVGLIVAVKNFKNKRERQTDAVR
jgi:hypothetical protein